MKILKFIYLLSLLLIDFYPISAQVNRYIVFLTDKNNSAYSLDKAEAFLSTRSLARKKRHDIEIDLLDLPVSDAYLQDLSSLNLDIFFTSKWMNALLIQSDSSTTQEVALKSYVDSVVFVAPGAKLTSEYGNYELPNDF